MSVESEKQLAAPRKVGPDYAGGDSRDGRNTEAAGLGVQAANAGSVAWRMLNALLLFASLVFCAGILTTAWGWHVGDLLPVALGLLMVILAFVLGTMLGFIRAAFNVMPPTH